jgi:uncharacterized membrane protein HdeD (DUF308 family)
METTMMSSGPYMRRAIYPWWVILLVGGAAVILGALLLTAPGATVAFLVQVLGWYWLVSGLFSIVSIFVSSQQWGWKLAAGALGIIAGLLVISHPLWSAVLIPTVLTLLLGIYGIIAGAVLLIGSFRGAGWGAAVLGVLAILLGVALIVAPFVATGAIIITAGILAVVGGVLAIISSFGMRREQREREEAVEEAMRAMEVPPAERTRSEGRGSR